MAYAASFFDGDAIYGRLAQAEQVSWTAVRSYRCLKQLAPGEVASVWPEVGFVCVSHHRISQHHRVEPGLIDVITGPAERTRLVCPLWSGPIDGLDCLTSGEEFAEELCRVGVYADPASLDEMLNDGLRRSLVEIAANKFNAEVIRSFRRRRLS